GEAAAGPREGAAVRPGLGRLAALSNPCPRGGRPAESRGGPTLNPGAPADRFAPGEVEERALPRRTVMSEETLFHQALARPPGERPSFLHQACAGDDARRQRREVLRRAHDEPGSFLMAPAAALTSPLASGAGGRTADEPFPPPAAAPGARVGPYE